MGYQSGRISHPDVKVLRILWRKAAVRPLSLDAVVESRRSMPQRARYLALAPRTAASSQAYARRRRLDVDGIATLQAASADHLPNPGRWPGLWNHGPLGRRGTNIGPSHQPQ